jgi:hypothetical protein
MVACLFYVTLVTPFEASFIEDPENPEDAFRGNLLVLMVFNRTLDALFLVDMILNFFIQYPRPFGIGMIRDPGQIVCHYLTGWFLIDIISLIPFDLVAIILTQRRYSPELLEDSGKGIVALRMIRLLRLLKLGRILKAGRIFQRWERRLTINHSVQALIKMLFYIILICHWMACLWMFCVQLQEDPTDTWLYNGGYSDYGTMDRYVCLLSMC